MTASMASKNISRKTALGIAARIHGKTALITGAGSGLGRALALDLHALGARLMLVGRTEHSLRETRELCMQSSAASHPGVEIFEADVSNWKGAQEAVRRAVAAFGSIDIVIANAGQGMHESIAKCELAVFEAMMKNNFYTSVSIIGSALAHVSKSRGCVCAVTSIQSVIGVPQHAPYSAAKHAVAGYLESLELEHPEIQVVELIPGWIEGTGLREKAVDGSGNIIPDRAGHKRHSRSSVSVEVCSRALIEGIALGTRRVYRPNFWRNILFVKFFMPKFLNKLIVKRQRYSASE